MSEETVALARQYFDALNKGTDASEHLRHPDIEVFDPPDFPDAGRYMGETAVRKLLDDTRDLGWDGQFSVQEILNAENEVIVLWQARVRPPRGGQGAVPIDVTFAHVLLFEEGKVRRVRQFLSRESALEAAGLAKSA